MSAKWGGVISEPNRKGTAVRSTCAVVLHAGLLAAAMMPACTGCNPILKAKRCFFAKNFPYDWPRTIHTCERILGQMQHLELGEVAQTIS